MENKVVFDRSTHPACLKDGCKKDTYGGSRGLCVGHYAVKQFLVKTGKTTWEQLEKEGLAKPKMTKEEKNSLRKNVTKLRQVRSKETGKLVFEKID